MDIIQHRVNKAEHFRTLAAGLGAEIDVRSHDGQLILAHDPHKPGAPLSEFLAAFSGAHKNDWLVVNPKEDGLEDDILALLRTHAITRFFFLDLTIPTLMRMTARQGEHRVAVRVSEVEPPEMAEGFIGSAEWAWLDCFKGEPPAAALVRRLRKNFKVCLVSPELQGYEPDRIKTFRTLAAEIDAVCTKHPERWS